jgi:hypothetical protein
MEDEERPPPVRCEERADLLVEFIEPFMDRGQVAAVIVGVQRIDLAERVGHGLGLDNRMRVGEPEERPPPDPG